MNLEVDEDKKQLKMSATEIAIVFLIIGMLSGIILYTKCVEKELNNNFSL